MPCIHYQAPDPAQSFSPGVFVHEHTTSTWALVVVTYLDEHLQNVRADCNGKGVERDIRPESESERGSDNKVAAVGKDQKGHGSVNGE